jgi:hypothetical protein
MQGTSAQEPDAEKKCPLCGRGLARSYGPQIRCVLCVRLGPPSVRRKQPTLKHAAIFAAEKDQVMITPDKETVQIKGGHNEEE